MINSCTFIGRVTTEPELKALEGGKCCCNFQLAVQRTKEITDFPPFAVYGKLAETFCDFVSKGDMVGIRASYRSKTKNGKKHYFFLVEYIQFLEKKKSAGDYNDIEIPYQTDFSVADSDGICGDDLPF